MKKVWNGFKTLVITILTVLVASNHTNFIYVGLERVGLADETIKKVILGALITFAIILIEAFLSCLFKILGKMFLVYLSRITIQVSIDNSGRQPNKIVFEPFNGEYEEKIIALNIAITPKGKLIMKILKKLNFQFSIFFNPKILDVEPFNNPNFSEIKDVSSNMDRIDYSILMNYDLDAINHLQYEKTIKFIVKPKRVEDDQCNLSYSIKSNILQTKVKHLCEFSYENLSVICRER